MKIGFIGFGEVSYTLSKIFFENGFDILTSVEGRSIKTKEFVDSIDYIELLSNFEEVAKEADILISANSPHSALGVALRYGSLTNGIFLDFNNISPETSKKIAHFIGDNHFVDSAIMGKVKSKELNIYLSGKLASKVEGFINDNLDKYIPFEGFATKWNRTHPNSLVAGYELGLKEKIQEFKNRKQKENAERVDVLNFEINKDLVNQFKKNKGEGNIESNKVNPLASNPIANDEFTLKKTTKENNNMFILFISP